MNFKKINEYLDRHKTKREIVYFMLFGSIALVAELVARFVCDISLKSLDYMLNIWPFPEQALGSFLAFFISNVIAKTISFVFNRKKTFKANNSATKSLILYIIVCVVLLVIETVIGTPLQNGLYRMMGGHYDELDFSTESAMLPGLYQLCGTLSQLIYCTGDSVIMFFMNKYVIMKREEQP